MNEREMENLIAAYPKEFFPRKNMVLIGRQETFSGVGRFDLLFEDEHQTKILMELKARVAKYEDASQLAKYKAVLDEGGEARILMWLVAPSIPRPVRDFMDHIGIEYTEIHEAEYRTVATRHNVTFESEVKTSPSSSGSLKSAPLGIVHGTNQQANQRWSFDGSEKVTGDAAGFLNRCDDSARTFFTAFFEHQKTLAKRSQITFPYKKTALQDGVDKLQSLIERLELAVGESPDAIAIESLHPEIYPKCRNLYEGDDYAEAVEKSFKLVRDRLRALTGYETGSEAFGKGNLYVNGAAAPHVDEDFQNGVKFLTMAIDRFRNEKSHTADGDISDPIRAYEYLRLSSLAMHLLEGAQSRSS